jgi:hypothetical protein
MPPHRKLCLKMMSNGTTAKRPNAATNRTPATIRLLAQPDALWVDLGKFAGHALAITQLFCSHAKCRFRLQSTLLNAATWSAQVRFQFLQLHGAQ